MEAKKADYLGTDWSWLRSIVGLIREEKTFTLFPHHASRLQEIASKLEHADAVDRVAKEIANRLEMEAAQHSADVDYYSRLNNKK